MDDVTVVFLLECLESASSKVTDLGFYSKLESFLKLHLEDLSKQMAKQYSKTLKSVYPFYFFIFIFIQKILVLFIYLF